MMTNAETTKTSTSDHKTRAADAEFEASKAAAMEAFDKLLEARNHFQNAATAAGIDLKHEALEQLLAGKSKAQDLGQELSELAKTKPGTTVALAFLGGFVLAQLLGRR
jgi:hypothetical protein